MKAFEGGGRPGRAPFGQDEFAFGDMPIPIFFVASSTRAWKGTLGGL